MIVGSIIFGVVFIVWFIARYIETNDFNGDYTGWERFKHMFYIKPKYIYRIKRKGGNYILQNWESGWDYHTNFNNKEDALKKLRDLLDVEILDPEKEVAGESTFTIAGIGRQHIVDLQEDNKELQVQLEDEKNISDNRRRINQNLQAESRALGLENTKLKEGNEVLIENAINRLGNTENLRIERDRLKRKNKELKEEIEGLIDENSGVHIKCNKLEEGNYRLKDENATLRDRVSLGFRVNKDHCSVITGLKGSVEELEEEIEIVIEDRGNFAQEIKKLKEELEELNDTNEGLVEELEGLEEECNPESNCCNNDDRLPYIGCDMTKSQLREEVYRYRELKEVNFKKWVESEEEVSRLKYKVHRLGNQRYYLDGLIIKLEKENEELVCNETKPKCCKPKEEICTCLTEHRLIGCGVESSRVVKVCDNCKLQPKCCKPEDNVQPECCEWHTDCKPDTDRMVMVIYDKSDPLIKQKGCYMQNLQIWMVQETCGWHEYSKVLGWKELKCGE